MAVDSLEEGLARANQTPFGLTAGLFAQDPDEIDRFLAGIEAGVVYVNRRAGATTGAWPDIQSFGGWKGSGTSGTGGGGPWYLRQYMREQSRTVVHN
jgi:1-pyrroline-5-carboxylate dehydrogenase